MQEYKVMPQGEGKVEMMKALYKELVAMFENDTTKLVNEMDKEHEEEQKFSFVKFVRLILSVLMMVSLAQLIFFGVGSSEQA